LELGCFGLFSTEGTRMNIVELLKELQSLDTILAPWMRDKIADAIAQLEAEQPHAYEYKSKSGISTLTHQPPDRLFMANEYERIPLYKEPAARQEMHAVVDIAPTSTVAAGPTLETILSPVNRMLHQQTLDTGLVSTDQWNNCIAPVLHKAEGNISKLERELAAANSALVQARNTIDQLDCTQREGGQTLHCRIEKPCLRCQLAAANNLTNEARAVAIEEATTSLVENGLPRDCIFVSNVSDLATQPPTHCVVPVEPTKEMIDAGYRAIGETHYSPVADNGWGEHAIRVFKAMLAARKQTGYEEAIIWLEGQSQKFGETEQKLNAANSRINELEQKCRLLRKELAER
jgi:hypothetical protein